MNYNKLIKTLRSCQNTNCELCHFADKQKENYVKFCRAMSAAADAIEELQNKVGVWMKVANELDKMYQELSDEIHDGWVSVKERLPKENGWYQVYAPSYSGGSSSGLKNINGIMYSALKNGKWSIEVGYHKRHGCVKAWMPLPEPPKEDADVYA